MDKVRPEANGSQEAGLYVYAIVPASFRQDQLGRGIDDSQLMTVAASDGPVAVVHEHSDPPFDGADADVEGWILEHGQAVESCWDMAGTVLPMSFNVIVAAGQQESAHDRLVAWLESNAAALEQRLSSLRGRVELRVEISLDQEAAAGGDAEVDDLRQDIAGRPAGVRRLLQKRIDTMERAVTEELADGLYPDYRRRLAARCEELVENRRSHPPQGFTPILTVSVLVPKTGVQDIGVELTAIREEQPAAQIRFLGPWPPYSFAEVAEVEELNDT